MERFQNVILTTRSHVKTKLEKGPVIPIELQIPVEYYSER